MIRACVLILLSVAVEACSSRQTSSPPALSATGNSVVGVASWYGPGFNRRPTSSGAIYDQEALTAASTLFPLGTQLRVTNLANGRTVDVSVNDHGPYAKGRALDLSHEAARMIGMIGPGTARVRMEVLRTPSGGPAFGQRYFVQVGSFSDAANARQARERLCGQYPDATVTQATAVEGTFYRVRMGVFMDRHQAEVRAAKLAHLGYRPIILTE